VRPRIASIHPNRPHPRDSANAYDYTGQDPINRYDLNGQCRTICSAWHHIKRHMSPIVAVAGVPSFVPGVGIGFFAATAVLGSAYMAQSDRLLRSPPRLSRHALSMPR
jgi:hypothetical protein